jgi:hypothetical protein
MAQWSNGHSAPVACSSDDVLCALARVSNGRSANAAVSDRSVSGSVRRVIVAQCGRSGVDSDDSGALVAEYDASVLSVSPVGMMSSSECSVSECDSGVRCRVGAEHDSGIDRGSVDDGEYVSLVVGVDVA